MSYRHSTGREEGGLEIRSLIKTRRRSWSSTGTNRAAKAIFRGCSRWFGRTSTIWMPGRLCFIWVWAVRLRGMTTAGRGSVTAGSDLMDHAPRPSVRLRFGDGETDGGRHRGRRSAGRRSIGDAWKISRIEVLF